MGKGLLLVGEPMGLLIAKQEGALETVKDYSLAVAGAEFNVATGISRLNHKVSYLTKLGDDPFGKLIESTLRGNGHGRVRQCGDVWLFLHFGEYATAIFGSLWLD